MGGMISTGGSGSTFNYRLRDSGTILSLTSKRSAIWYDKRRMVPQCRKFPLKGYRIDSTDFLLSNVDCRFTKRPDRQDSSESSEICCWF
jgi:hypothetical protein